MSPLDSFSTLPMTHARIETTSRSLPACRTEHYMQASAYMGRLGDHATPVWEGGSELASLWHPPARASSPQRREPSCQRQWIAWAPPTQPPAGPYGI